MMRLEYFVHGRGRGHASRASVIVPALRRDGWRVRLSAGDDALVPLADASPVRRVRTVLPGPMAGVHLASRTASELRHLRRVAPDAVVSDGDQAAIVAARLLRLPCVAVGHGLVFGGCHLPPSLPRLPLLHQRLNAWLPSHLADAVVAVHFLPARAHSGAVTVARPEVPDAFTPAEGETSFRDFVLAYFRDGNGHGAIEHAAALGERVVVADGKAPRRTFLRLLARCRAVIASAGSNVLAECVMARRPVLALHRARDAEQRLNGILAERAGVAMSCSFEALDADRMDAFLTRVQREDFAHVDLVGGLLPVSVAVREALERVLRSDARRRHGDAA